MTAAARLSLVVTSTVVMLARCAPEPIALVLAVHVGLAQALANLAGCK